MPARGGRVIKAVLKVRPSITVILVPLFCIAALTAAPAQSTFFTTLASFDESNGWCPYAAPVQATDGNFYGITEAGGAYGNNSGMVFKMTPAGTLTGLYSFCSQSNCTDGDSPFGGLVQATDGNFYGTTWDGGTYGLGTVFNITPAGTLTTMHSFDGADGSNPSAGLLQVSNGNFYGTTYGGGANDNCGSEGCGTVFEITANGSLTTLYSFCPQPQCVDGANPQAALVQTTDGNFYGTTVLGGANNSGTVFRITPSGTLTTLYSFCSQPKCTDGNEPRAGLVQATDGNFYGTTWTGGTYGDGTVFKITSAGRLTTLHGFDQADGYLPYAGLVQASDGNFYGATVYGGHYGNGTVFKINSSGMLTTLHSFDTTDGELPYGGLLQATDGKLYGTTCVGGTSDNCGSGCGTVFRMNLVHSCATCRP